MPMSRRPSDRALRRAVAGLARLHPDDAEAILAALDPAEKARVDALVSDFAGHGAAENPPEPQPEWAYESVSPWLLARIDPDDRRRSRQAGREFVLITDTSREALREAAAPFRRQVNPASRNGMALLDQLWRLFASRRG
jgi:hypothetical protein